MSEPCKIFKSAIQSQSAVTQSEWRTQARALYGKFMKGYPLAEMKGYWRAGLAPEEAVARAIARRRPHTGQRLGGVAEMPSVPVF